MFCSAFFSKLTHKITAAWGNVMSAVALTNTLLWHSVLCRGITLTLPFPPSVERAHNSRNTELSNRISESSPSEWLLNYYYIYFRFPHLQPLSEFTRQRTLHILLNIDILLCTTLSPLTQALNLPALPYIFITKPNGVSLFSQNHSYRQGNWQGRSLKTAMVCICKSRTAHSNRLPGFGL